MQIEYGLFDAMVLQRTKGDVSDAAFSGVTTAKVDGRVRAKVTSRGQTVRGFASIVAGRVTKGKIVGRLKGLPVGGPYDIELSIDVAGGIETVVVRDVLVGDVWILGGQSNMQGIGRIDPPIKPNASVRAFYLNDTWGVANDPLNELHTSVDAFHRGWGGKISKEYGRGLGVPFGQAMFKATRVPQGLMPCAYCGSEMSQWDPALKKLGGGSLFGAMARRLKKNGGRVAGVLWYQGCSDTAADRVDKYGAKTKKLFAAFRRECGDAKLPIVMVQIARAFGGDDAMSQGWNRVQDIQRRLPTKVKRLACVPAIDLGHDDSGHISGRGHMRLGVRVADAMLSLTAPKLGTKPPIELESVEARPRKFFGTQIVVSFKNVVGELRSTGLPHGFTLVNASGVGVPHIFAVDLVGSKAILHTEVKKADLGSYSLSYGHGFAPVCNVTDEADRSLPVFRGQYFGKGRALSPWVVKWRISRLLSECVPVEKLKMPDVRDRSLGWRDAELAYAGWAVSRHEEIAATSAGEDRLMHFATTVSCSQAMKLRFLFDYDGPFVMWLDGRCVWCDPKGINPIVPDQHGFVTKLTKGEHRIVVSMGTNKGAAWGFCLRAERMDVSTATFRRGPQAYAMPEFGN